MCTDEDKISKKAILRRLNDVEGAVRHLFSKTSNGASARIQLKAFLDGLSHAREVIENTHPDGILIVRRR